MLGILGFIFGFIACYFIFIRDIFFKSQIMTVYYNDGSWFKGERKYNFPAKETHGTHHFIVLEGSEQFNNFVGKRVAVPINSVKYFTIDKM